MQYDRLVTGLAAVLGTITVVFAVLGLVYNPVSLFVALLFGASTYFVYYHASGRLAARVYRRVEVQAARGSGGPDARSRTRAQSGRRRQAGGRQQTDGRRQRGGFDAGPREEWTPPRDGATARQAAGAARGRNQRRRVRQPAAGSADTTAGEAYRTLGVDPDADQETVKEAYREKVKEVHPDTTDGDEESFREVQDAYERLTD